MCPSQKQERTKGHITKEKFIELLEQMKGKLEIIEFSLYGEILIHPDFDWFIKYAKSKNIKTSLSTNATFLNRENSLRLIDSGIDHLIISIDDVSGGNYNEIRKGSQFEKIFINTQDFLKLNNGKVFTVIQKIHMTLNQSSTWNYLSEMLPLRPSLVRLKPYRDIDSQKKHLRTKKNKNFESIQCPYLWKSPIITWKGELIPCVHDYNVTMPLGKSENENIQKIWNNEKFQEMRGKHIAGQKETIPLCKGCTAIDLSLLTLAMSSVFDGLNFRKVMSVFQTICILIEDF
jgi:radical SAM protein with 4Fe4S-binding SPASM domain